MRAQIMALSRQLPLLFFICFVNVTAVAWTHYDVAPAAFTVLFPGALAVGYSFLTWRWISVSYRPPSHADACRLLKSTIIQAPIATAVSMAWALALIPYGDAYAQGHVIFTIGITITSCIFCQAQLRPAAVLVAGVTAASFGVFVLDTGRPVFVAIGLSLILALAAMVYIAMISWRDFANMIAFQKDLEASRAENLRLANLDTLTELPNRRRFFADLTDALDRDRRRDRRFVVGVVDLDGFKTINDLFGHAAGDRVLVEAARRMRSLAQEGVSFSRLGGDEFGLIVDLDWTAPEIQSFGERLCEALKGSFALPEGVVEISGSAGFAIFPEAGSTVELLYERADYSLYHAKKHTRGRPVIFSIEHETEIRAQANIERRLREADIETEMWLDFQPIVDVERGEVVAFEALARWQSPHLGRVAPDVFIRVAERSDLIHVLTRSLLRKALAAAAAWPAEIGVSFNLSARDLTSREAIANIVAIIERGGVAANRIDLEVTETALIHDFDLASQSLRTLKALGVGISLDDFGTGYSSLGYLQRLPIDKVKIDRGFINEVETRQSCRAIVKSVTDLCENLHLKCIVEGVETDAQMRVLRELGCVAMQGYFFAKPMPAARTSLFLEDAQWPSSRRSRELRAVAS